MAITINVNSINRTIDVDVMLLFCGVLRDVLVMTRTKFGCGVPLCLASTVHLSEVSARGTTGAE
jgi:aerobic-type carbon monoxide dehydrogenase small subunit (CoxS/CutS family)